MEPLILRLFDYLKFQALTEDGCALVARLRRPYDPDDVKPLQEDCEILGRSMLFLACDASCYWRNGITFGHRGTGRRKFDG